VGARALRAEIKARGVMSGAHRGPAGALLSTLFGGAGPRAQTYSQRYSRRFQAMTRAARIAATT